MAAVPGSRGACCPDLGVGVGRSLDTGFAVTSTRLRACCVSGCQGTSSGLCHSGLPLLQQSAAVLLRSGLLAGASVAVGPVRSARPWSAPSGGGGLLEALGFGMLFLLCTSFLMTCGVLGAPRLFPSCFGCLSVVLIDERCSSFSGIGSVSLLPSFSGWEKGGCSYFP